MEVAEAKQNRFHLAVALLESFLVQGCECALDIRLQSSGGLVRDLNTAIQQTNGDGVRCIRR